MRKYNRFYGRQLVFVSRQEIVVVRWRPSYPLRLILLPWRTSNNLNLPAVVMAQVS